MAERMAEITVQTHSTALFCQLNDFVTRESFTDVQFICKGGHKVYAHKLMLVTVSKMIRTVLESIDSTDMITIHVPDVSSMMLHRVINFLYVGSEQFNKSDMDQFKHVLNLLDISLFLKNQNNSDESQVSTMNFSPGPAHQSQAIQPAPETPCNTNSSVTAPTVVTPAASVSRDSCFIAVQDQQQPQQYVMVPASQISSYPELSNQFSNILLQQDPSLLANQQRQTEPVNEIPTQFSSQKINQGHDTATPTITSVTSLQKSRPQNVGVKRSYQVASSSDISNNPSTSNSHEVIILDDDTELESKHAVLEVSKSRLQHSASCTSDDSKVKKVKPSSRQAVTRQAVQNRQVLQVDIDDEPTGPSSYITTARIEPVRSSMSSHRKTRINYS